MAKVMKIRCEKSSTAKRLFDLLKNNGKKVSDLKEKEFHIQMDNFSEGDLRLEIQKLIESDKSLKGWILVDGNTVYGISAYVNEMKRLKKRGNTQIISNGFYDFMYQNFTIAHYNKRGWIEYNPKYTDVVRILTEGVKTIPPWYSDLRTTVRAMLEVA